MFKNYFSLCVPSVVLTDDQRWSSDARVSLLSVLPQPPEHRGAAALARPGNVCCRWGTLRTWLGVWTKRFLGLDWNLKQVKDTSRSDYQHCRSVMYITLLSSFSWDLFTDWLVLQLRGRRTLCFCWGDQVPVLSHRSPPPLENLQELRLPDISSGSPPGWYPAVGLAFNVVLVCRTYTNDLQHRLVNQSWL